MKSTLLKQIFEAERTFCNQTVSQAKHQLPSLNLSDFQWFLTSCLDPLMLHYETVNFDQAKTIALSGFQNGLEISGQNWLKQPDRKEVIFHTWNTLFPSLLSLITQNPGVVFSQTCNLYHHLFTFGDHYPNKWLALMAPVAAKLDRPEVFKSVGVVSAWLSGLAHLRDSALKEAETLNPEVVMPLFNIAEENKVQSFLTLLRANRWTSVHGSHFSHLLSSSYKLQIRVGQSNHLGGDFPEPPTVFSSGNQLLVKSGSSVWRLYADAFGTTTIPAHQDDLIHLPDMANRPEVLEGFGSLTDLKDLRSFSSVACLADTLALTSDDTFSVMIMSLPYIEPED